MLRSSTRSIFLPSRHVIVWFYHVGMSASEADMLDREEEKRDEEEIEANTQQTLDSLSAQREQVTSSLVTVA